MMIVNILYVDPRTSDNFVICPSCMGIFRTCDWVSVDPTKVGNWQQIYDGIDGLGLSSIYF